MLKVTGRFTFAVAKKLIENAVKGNPHFKPGKGEHGGCSWFHVSGEAHAGIDNQGKDVTVTAYIDENYVKKDMDLVKNQIVAIDKKYPKLIEERPREFDLEVWNSIGEVCAARDKATLLYVPRCKLSVRDGYFLLLPAGAADHLKVDFKELDNANVAVFSKENFSVQQYENERVGYEQKKNEELSRVITLWIGPYKGQEDVAKKEILRVVRSLRPLYGTTDFRVEFNIRIVNFRSISKENPWGGGQKSVAEAGHFGIVSLSHPNYREARNAYKKLLPTAKGSGKVHCFQGQNWGDAGKGEVRLPKQEPLKSDTEDQVLARTYEPG